MLSILIPIYNIDCTKLVNELHKQCVKSKVKFEILCFDDCSKPEIKEKNQVLAFLFGVSYVELSENQGRAKIRNLLASNASNPYLLFIDADSKIPNKSYIRNYVLHLNTQLVIYGGRSYQKNKPGAKKMLHWLYGSQREALSAQKRNRSPHLNFLSNNFVVPAKIFAAHPFDPAHEGYGYEDTVFATELKKSGIPVGHIDNPLLHTGLENSEVFLKKTKNALDNLVQLFLNGSILDTRLILAHRRLKKFGLLNFLIRFIEKRMTFYEQNLLGTSPKLRYFDLWKLYYFTKKMNKSEH